MLKRVLLGLVIGLVIGGGLAAVLVAAFQMPTWSAVLAYLFAALAGVLAGLFAGKPVWKGAIEASLKAVFGALLACGAMFAMRQWGGGLELNLSAIHAGSGAVGDLPAVALPLIAGILGLLYGLDNTPASQEEKKKPVPARAVAAGARAKGGAPRVAPREAPAEEEELEAAPRKSKR